MTEEYIKKSTIIKFIAERLSSSDKSKQFGHDAVEILTEIEFMENADVRPVVRSKWKLLPNGNGICQHCYFTALAVWDFDNWLNFCPHCGADMREMYGVVHTKEGDELDIGSGNGYPAANLSNFAPHPFVIDGIECNSMEGFLQSLKFSNPDIQKEVCSLVGKAAKFKGKKKKWYRDQMLYWQGEIYPRDSQAYQDLLDRAFAALATNESFRKALLATGNANLTHSIGKNKITETVLTRQEFCSRLMNIREQLKR